MTPVLLRGPGDVHITRVLRDPAEKRVADSGYQRGQTISAGY